MSVKIKIDESSVAFFELISEISGETITLCDQCGTCSGGCPFVNDMDLMPSQLMRMALLGQEDVLESKTMWLCATCNTCTVRCPRGLDVSKVAEALRLVKLRHSVDKIDLNKISKDELKELPPIVIIAANRKLVS